MSYQQRKRFLHSYRFYHWDDPYLFKKAQDDVLRRCIPEDEQANVLKFCHELHSVGHFSGKKTAYKVLQIGLYWPSIFQDAMS